jgi:ankyrin repeat protein
MIDILSRFGAQINAVDCFGQTRLVMAAWRGYTETVNNLLEAGAATDTFNLTGRTVRDWAAVNGIDKIIGTLGQPN